MILLLLAGTLLAAVGGARVADSQSDFSGTQGDNGWYWKYNGGDFITEFPTYGASRIGGSRSWQNAGTWCHLSAAAMHTTTGGGTVACASPVGYCAPLLRWENPSQANNVTVELTASHTGATYATRDGVILTLSVNGEVEANFSTPFTINNVYGPFNVSYLELLLDPINNCNSDLTSYRLEIFEPDPTPSPTPSSRPTASDTATATVTRTNTRSPSPTPTGICHTIFTHVYGTQETVANGFFTVTHGANVIHNPPYAVCGRSPTCVDNGASCVCTYTGGDNTYGCPSQRSAVITYTFGPNNIAYTAESPTCRYHFSRAFSFPSPSPSPTVTPTYTPTASHSPSPSATGICNEIKNYVNGRTETVYDNATRFNLFHGRYITTSYLQDFDMLLGIFNGCVENGDSCLCNYINGYTFDCEGGASRNALVNFTHGSSFQTSYSNRSDCSFVFNASYIRPSFSPSPTLTPTTTASRTATATSSASWTPTATASTSETRTQTASFTATATQTASATFTASITASATASATASETATQTASETASATPTYTATITPTVTPTGICNDVRNYVFGRTDRPTEDYTIYHGSHLTHYYYPAQHVLIGNNPTCTDYNDECVCVYGDGNPAFCDGGRRGIVRYSFDEVYRTILVNDTNPVCLYQFNTTFFLPYLSPTATRSGTPLPTATQTPTPTVSGTAYPTFAPEFEMAFLYTIETPPNFPHIPENATRDQLESIAAGFISGINASELGDNLVDYLAVLASRLSVASPYMSLTLNGDGFTWSMVSGNETAEINVGNVSAKLPALTEWVVYSFLAPTTNSSFPTFTVDAIGASDDKYSVSALKSPFLFSVSATPPEGRTIECIYWNGTDWDTAGCAFVNGNCACNHFTQFGTRLKSIIETNAIMFGAADDVYSASGFQKYSTFYGLIIGIFLVIVFLFFCLLKIDGYGKTKYRLAVEEIDEVCTVLGYDKPHTPQPSIHLPQAEGKSMFKRILSALTIRLFYHHSYLGTFFRYDPRLPRGFRLMLLATVAFHTLFMTVFFYGYTKVDAEMTVVESIFLSLLTSALNIPFLRTLKKVLNSVGASEYAVRFPDFAYEYKRRRAFEMALEKTPTSELQRVVESLETGKSAAAAIRVSPGGRRRDKQEGVEYTDTSQLGGDTTDSFMMVLIERIFHRCLLCKRAPPGGFVLALDIAAQPDPHYETPSCNALPTKTLGGFCLSVAMFVYIGWVMNYLLLFTAVHSSATMSTIARSSGVSQATSIVLTQPLTLIFTLLGNWLVGRYMRRGNAISSTNHIGFFADPFFKKNSSSLSGSWAYWIFLYGGSTASIGLSEENRSLGYSSTQVALAWLNGVKDVGTTPRDAALTTLYVYLRGIRTPLFGRAAAAAEAANEIRGLLSNSLDSKIAPTEKINEAEACEVVEMMKEIEHT